MAVALLATGCGDDEPEAGSGRDDPSSEAPADPGEAGDPGDDGGAASEEDLPVFCDLVTAEQVGAALGADVTIATGPFDACEFDQADVHEISGSLGAVLVDTGNGGFDAYRGGAAAAMTDAEDHDVAGVGDDAFVTTGTFGGGEAVQAAGGVLVGGVVYTVNLTQGNAGHTAEEMVAAGEALLALMVEAAG